MNDWLDALHTRLRIGATVVRVVVANIVGSTPREAGATMLIGADFIESTIGGGNLEMQAIDLARSMLDDTHSAARVERLVLGAMLGQCCGGALELWFERYDPSALSFVAEMLHARDSGKLLLTTQGNCAERQLFSRTELAALGITLPARFDTTGITLLSMRGDNSRTTTALIECIEKKCDALWLFGAGHVGKALIHALTHLPWRVMWVDSRAAEFPEMIPSNVTPLCCDDPVALAATIPRSAYVLLMTHDHQLDYALCRAVLARDANIWLGMIGSQTKSVHFRGRLRREGLRADAIERMHCPIGLSSLHSKLPAAIAISVAAQLLEAVEFQKTEHRPSPLPVRPQGSKGEGKYMSNTSPVNYVDEYSR